MKNLQLFLIILLALALRIPGIFWGNIDKPTHNLWEPDEFQHAQIAAKQIHSLDAELYPTRDFSRIWNMRAFGNQVGILAFIAYQFDLLQLTENKLKLGDKNHCLKWSLKLGTSALGLRPPANRAIHAELPQQNINE